MRMTFAALAAALTLSTTSIMPMQASAAIGSQGECYNAVITWCNNTHPEHASACAGSGMDECDEEFGNAAAGLGFDKIKVQPRGDGSFKFQLISKARKFREWTGGNGNGRQDTGRQAEQNGRETR